MATATARRTSRSHVPPAVCVASGQITAGRDATSRWTWGPHFDGGSWIIQRKEQQPWAIRVVWDGDHEDNADLGTSIDVRLERIVWELEHPAIVAALIEAEATTRPRLRPRTVGTVPDAIADEIARFNAQARSDLR